MIISGMADLLQHIGGWHVGCECHQKVSALVDLAERSGYVGRRLHYAPIIPEGAPAFEVMDLGLDKLEKLAGIEVRAKATKMRQWYRDNTAAPPV